MARYVSVGSLPGSVSIRAPEFREWDLNFIVTARDMVLLTGESLQRVRTELFRVLHKLLLPVRTGH